MDYKYNLLADYNKFCKIHDTSVSCFSKKELLKKYPDKDFKIIGEISGKVYESEKIYDEQPKTIILKDTEYIVENLNSNLKFIYGRYHFINVGDNNYVVILKNRLPLIFIVILVFVLATVGGIAIGKNIKNKPVKPSEQDITEDINKPIMPDHDLIGLTDDDSERVSSPKGGGNVSMEYAKYANIKLSTGEITVHFKNPNDSNHSIGLNLYVVSGEDEILIAQSGAIPPKNMVSKITLLDGKENLLKEGIYKGKFKVDYYDLVSGEKAVVNSAIEDVKITVTN